MLIRHYIANRVTFELSRSLEREELGAALLAAQELVASHVRKKDTYVVDGADILLVEVLTKGSYAAAMGLTSQEQRTSQRLEQFCSRLADIPAPP